MQQNETIMKTGICTVTAKGSVVCKRARPDTQVAIAFLTVCVMNPSEDDWNKSGHMLQHLKSTKDLVLTLDAQNCNVIKWYADGAHTLHPDVRGCSRITLKLGKGHPTSSSANKN